MKKIAGRVFRLVCGLVPLIFAGVFLVSTVSLYRTVTADRRTESELKTIFTKLPKNSRRAGNINAILTAEDMKLRAWNEDKKSWKSLDSSRVVHFATHGYEPVEKLSYKMPSSARVTHLSTHGAPLEKRSYESSKSWDKASAACRLQFSDLEARDVHQRAVSISSSFDALLSSLAELFTTIKFTEDEVRFAHAHYAFSVSLEREDAYQKYIYNRLALEKREQKHLIKPINYYESRKQLAKAYLQLATVGDPMQERISTDDLQNAELEMNQLRQEVGSLKIQLAQAQKSKAERWIPIGIAIISLLIALSTHLITWRIERRQAREAELITLKRHELEQTILQRSLQIQEVRCRIIKPTEREIELYSSHTSSSIISST